MDPPRFRLFDLPRELRDKIYGHLHHEVQRRWPVDLESNLKDRAILRICRVTVHNAPIVSALLCNSRLRKEYGSSPCFKEAIVTLDILPARWGTVRNEDRTGAKLLAARLTKLRHLTLYLNIQHGTGGLNIIIYELDWIMEKLYAKSPNLSSVYLAVRKVVQDGIVNPILPTYLRACLTGAEQMDGGEYLRRWVTPRKKHAMPSSFNSFDGLPNRQRGEGYMVEYEGRPKRNTLHSRGASRYYPSIAVEPSVPTERYHLSSIVGLYVFAEENGKREKHVWRKDDILKTWPVRKPKGGMLDDFEAKDRRLVVKHLNKVRGWKELGDEELKEWKRKSMKEQAERRKLLGL